MESYSLVIHVVQLNQELLYRVCIQIVIGLAYDVKEVPPGQDRLLVIFRKSRDDVKAIRHGVVLFQTDIDAPGLKFNQPAVKPVVNAFSGIGVVCPFGVLKI